MLMSQKSFIIHNKRLDSIHVGNIFIHANKYFFIYFTY